ncbi:clarin-3 [Frankliniella occidentalis]|uniref:Clarin-3 n=1 Tax=Frankliniella occidentalis TaxID=133901 RepID=A0A6J1S5V2_FRAOC|nr:clarin-3 [Frankliniella occidentalis]
MNLWKRGMVFITFLGACLALGLLVAALTTRQWVTARAIRTSNPNESQGRVALGLFHGRKELNVAYGWRSYDVNVVDLARAEEDLLLYGLWVATICSLGGALLFCALAGVFAVINTATTPIGALTGVPGLYLWNTLAMLLDLGAVGLWAVQFHQKLQFNVMTREDRENYWISTNMATFGASFWFVVGAAVVHVLNMTAIFFGTREPREKTAPAPMLEEKGNGAIMLY